MKSIAVFFPQSLYSAWSVSEGIVDTLKRMGHEPIACPIVPGTEKISRSQFPNLEQLNECDGVLVSGPEHIGNPAWKKDYIGALYPKWKEIKAPKVAWLHETLERADYHHLPIESFRANYDTVFTPAAQDAVDGVRFLPFGVDADMFRECVYAGSAEHLCDYYCEDWRRSVRTIPVGFVGLCYGPRAEFVNKYGMQDIIRFGKCEVTDFDGVNVRKSTELYAETLRRTKIMPVLPSLCRHAVTKIFEIPACGAVVVTHKVEDPRNHILKSGVYYETGEELRSILTDLLTNDAKREEIARKQCEEVHAHHRLDQRLEKILEAMR